MLHPWCKEGPTSWHYDKINPESTTCARQRRIKHKWVRPVWYLATFKLNSTYKTPCDIKMEFYLYRVVLKWHFTCKVPRGVEGGIQSWHVDARLPNIRDDVTNWHLTHVDVWLIRCHSEQRHGDCRHKDVYLLNWIIIIVNQDYRRWIESVSLWNRTVVTHMFTCWNASLSLWTITVVKQIFIYL